MIDIEILKKAVDKAEKNGWKMPICEEHKREDFDKILPMIVQHDVYFSLIFSHNFAEYFWGKKITILWKKYDWQIHLQRMVLEKEPLKYIEKFL